MVIYETHSRRSKNNSRRSPSTRRSRSRRSPYRHRSSSSSRRKRSSSRKRSRRNSRSRRSRSRTRNDVNKNKLNEPLTMYTIDGCSACKNAKELCDKKGIKYRALPRAGNEELIKKLTNDYKYVPVIIDRNNKFIGGFQELQKLTS